MLVLNTTSPRASPYAPAAAPLYQVPSSKARMASTIVVLRRSAFGVLRSPFIPCHRSADRLHRILRAHTPLLIPDGVLAAVCRVTPQTQLFNREIGSSMAPRGCSVLRRSLDKGAESTTVGLSGFIARAT